MKYGFDLDDTICDTASIINKYAIKFDKEILRGNGIISKSANCRDYYYFLEGLNWTRENIKSFFDKYYLDIINEVKIKENVRDTLVELKKRGNDIYIITARRKRNGNIVEKITSNWLILNGIKYDKLYINCKQKAGLVKKLKIDVFVDDSYANCLEVKNNTKAKVYMMKTEYNKGIKDESISSIESIYELINKK